MRGSGVLIYSFGVSVDGFIADRDGHFAWTAPSDDLFAFHLERIRELGSTILGRRLYEAMTVWETDPALRDTPLHVGFADAWAALPKVVFSRTLTKVRGRARLATRALDDEVALATRDGALVEIGGAGLAGQAFEQGLLDEIRIFRHPVVVGGGIRHLPAIARTTRLDLVEARTFDSKVGYERYRVCR